MTEEKQRKLKDRASKAVTDGRFKDALGAYGAIVKEDPSELGCMTKIGDLHRRLGERDEAVRAYGCVAQAYALDGLFLKAVAICKLILSVDSGNAAAQEMLLELHEKRRASGSGSAGHTITPKIPPRLVRSAASVRNAASVRSTATVRSAAGVRSTATASSVSPPASVASAVDAKTASPAAFAAWPVASGTAPHPPRANSLDEEFDIEECAPVVDSSPEMQIDEPIEITDPERVPSRGAALPHIPLFSDLPKDAFIEILVRMKMRETMPGEYVITEGETGDSFFVLATGRVRVCRRQRDGTEQVLAHLADGAFFGEMALLGSSVRTASVIAEDECQIFEISKALLDGILVTFPSVANVLQNFYRQRLLSTTMATHPLFRPFTPGERHELMEMFQSRRFAEREIVVSEGKHGDGLYILLSGKLEVSKSVDGKRLVIAALYPGDVFGEMSLLMNRPAIASVSVLSECFVLRLPKPKFDEVIMTHPQVLELVATLSADRASMNEALFHRLEDAAQQGVRLI